MSACERAIEVEDMILGLRSEDTDDLAAHVETCADCTEAQEMFLAERALFAARPAVEAPPLDTKPIVKPTPFRAYAFRIVPALAGLAAGVAALVAGHPFAPRPLDCAPSATAAIAPAPEDLDPTRPLTCEARGFSAPAPAMTLANYEAPLCIGSELHAHAAPAAGANAVCDQPASMSVATP